MQSYFNRIAGNSQAKSRIGENIAKGTLPHALLLSGGEGVGKLTFALEIAAAVNCENKGNLSHPLPCHACNTCRRIFEGKFLDVKIIQREGSRASVSIEDVRSAKSDMALSPSESDCKIYIFKDAHLMTAAAQNSLLKALEEPVGRTFMILLAEQEDKLLTTIKSRVQTIPMQRFSESDIDEYISERRSDLLSVKRSDPEGYRASLLAAEGSIGRAISYLSPDMISEIMQRRALADRLLSAFSKKTEYKEIKSAVASLPAKRQELLSMLDEIINGVRDIIALRYSKNARLRHFAAREDAERLSSLIGAVRAVAIYELLTDIYEDCQKNANISSLMTRLSSTIPTI